MPEIKWIKITTTMFDDEKICLIESMPDADALLVIWVKLICLAGKNNKNGLIQLADMLPYSPETLATILRRPLNTVRLALDTFQKLAMIEVHPDGLFLLNFAKHQNIEGMERVRLLARERVRKFREVQQLLPERVTLRNVTVTPQIRIDKIRLDKEEKERREAGMGEENRKGVPPDTLLRGNEKDDGGTGGPETPESAADLWEKVKDELRKTISAPNFRTFLAGTTGLSLSHSQLVVAVPRIFIAKYLDKNQRGIIEKTLFNLAGDRLMLVFQAQEGK